MKKITYAMLFFILFQFTVFASQNDPPCHKESQGFKIEKADTRIEPQEANRLEEEKSHFAEFRFSKQYVVIQVAVQDLQSGGSSFLPETKYFFTFYKKEKFHHQTARRYIDSKSDKSNEVLVA